MLNTSSPWHLQGHGSLRANTSHINILTKYEMQGTSPYMAMLVLRATSLDDDTPSPAELMGNRRYKTTFLTITRAPHNSEEVKLSLSRKQG